MGKYFINRCITIYLFFVQFTVDTESRKSSDGTLLIVTIFEEPFMMLKKDHENQINIARGSIIDSSLVEGYSADLAHMICRDKLKLPYKFLIETKYGREVENGTWDGIIGTLINRTADLSVAPVVVTEARQKVVDFSQSFMDVGLSIMIHKSQKQNFGTLPSMFSYSIKISFFAVISYLFVRVLLFLLTRSSSYQCRFEKKQDDAQLDTLSICDTLFLSLSLFLHRNSCILPKPLSGRLSKCTWCTLIVIILLFFVFNLCIVLSFRKAPINIVTIEDLAKQTEIRYGTIRNGSTMAFFSASKIKIFKDMWNFMMQHGDDAFVASNREGIEKVRQSNGKYAFILESTFNDYANERLPCETARLGDNLNTYSYGIATPFHSNLKEAIRKSVAELKQNGDLEVLKRKWYYKRSECRNSDNKDKRKGIISSLFNFAKLFYLLAIGIFVAIIISVFELLLKVKLNLCQFNQAAENAVS